MPAAPKAIVFARVLLAATFVVAITQGSIARAEETGAAAALFQAGLAEMQASNYAAACPKLTESYWLDPRPGVLFTLAECEGKWGKIASAIAHYDDYLRLFESMSTGQKAIQRERAELARNQRAALADKVPTLVLTLPKAAPADAVVRRDNMVLGRPSLGVALPIDPGLHVVVVQLPSGKTVSRDVEIHQGEHLTIELELPKAAEAPLAPSTVTAKPVLAKAPSRTLPLVLLGVGAAGLAAGGVTGGLALDSKSTIVAHCHGSVCDSQGKDAADRGKTLGWTSTVAFAGGTAALGAAAFLWFFPPKRGNTERTGLLPSSWAVANTTVYGVQGDF